MAVATTSIDLIDMAFLLIFAAKIAFAEEIFRADRHATALLHSGNVAIRGAQFARRSRRTNLGLMDVTRQHRCAFLCVLSVAYLWSTLKMNRTAARGTTHEK
jgi:hypothetical protein